jgi:hypothetical protein
MKLVSNSFRRAGVQKFCGALLTVMTLASLTYAQTITSGENKGEGHDHVQKR